MFLFKLIKNKNFNSVKKFIKVYYIVWSALSAVDFIAGIVSAVLFAINNTVLYLILLCTFFVSALLFYSITLFSCVSLYSCVAFVAEPKSESLRNEGIKKECAEILKAQQMFQSGLYEAEEFNREKRAYFDKIYEEFQGMSRREILLNFMYLNKSGAIADNELKKEKEYYFNEKNYKNALILMRGGDYAEAAAEFEKLGNFRASKEMLKKLKDEGKI